MSELVVDCTVRKLEDKLVRKKDMEQEKGILLLKNEEGYSVTIQGPKALLEGFVPEMPVVVKVKRVQRTIEESAS